MQMKDNAGGSHLFCTGRYDQPGAETSMENKILIKCEINSDTHPKASCHAARIESCYTITPASFSLLAAKPHNCGCIACQAYIWGKGKIWPCVILMWASIYTTERHMNHYLYCIHNVQSIICKQLKNSAVQMENHICQSVLLPRLKSRCTLTRDFFAITSMPYNYSLENAPQDAFLPVPCKNYSTAKH